ncbi:MAG: DUF2254 domain-containing protein [Desulfobacteraceae bacterium]|nr:MAG: DUF2254 domain-containing protein [Desulfobacteraceae bacterium]
MKAQLYKKWDGLRSSFYFLPSLLVGTVVVFAFIAVELDGVIPNDWAHGLIYTGSAEGASTILGTIAGSMITTAGVVFSLTLIALTLASNQFGPRLLRNFRRDTVTQFVIGSFVSTFLYCLLVLRSIRREDAGSFVPHLSVSIAVLFALASLAALIYFIHHIAVSIQADEVIARVYAELTQGIERIFPEKIGEEDPGHPTERHDPPLSKQFDRDAFPVNSVRDGYLQLIDPDSMMKLAVQEDALIRVERRPGQYVAVGTPLVRVWPGERGSETLKARVLEAFIIGSNRTPVQDVEFSINQLVEVAVRALSPGINDPFTAITCVDRLGSALCRLAEREMPSPYRRDEQGRLRVVVASSVTFPGIADAALNQIRQAARSNAAVTIRLLETIAQIAGFAPREEDRASLLGHAEMIARGAIEGLPEIEDRHTVEARFQTARQALVQ